MNKKKVLVADDEAIILKVIHQELINEGYEVDIVHDGEEACTKVREKKYDLVILDNKMPKVNGIDVLKKIKKFNPKIVVIMMTAFGTINNAVEAMKFGAYDYLTKPFDNNDLINKVSQAFKIADNLTYKSNNNKVYKNQIVGSSNEIMEIKKKIEKIKNLDTTILLTGESGTGKGLAAKILHFNGIRRQSPFIELNCAAIPETLLESELFGHEAGAFTDAKKLKKGILEQADGGTVFLDEIGDMSLSLQAKLVKAVEERSFRRVGGTRDITVDICVMAATNQDLKSLVKNGGFREDLYHRLNVINFEMPSLRDRMEDIPLITDYFVSYFNIDLNKSISLIPSEIRKTFLHYDWPGNVRELRSTIERAVLLSDDGVLNPKYMKLEEGDNLKFQDGDDKMVIDIPLDDASLYKIERKVITKALDLQNWNQTRTAEMLGITREVLRYRMKKWGLLS